MLHVLDGLPLPPHPPFTAAESKDPFVRITKPEQACIPLPPPTINGIFVSVVDPQRALTTTEEIELFTATSDTVQRVRTVLRAHGYESHFLGCYRVPYSQTLVFAHRRWWIIGPQIDVGRCADSIQRQLVLSRQRVDRDQLRVIYAMPLDWRPENTMRYITYDRTLRGSAGAAERRLIGVPIMPLDSQFATWIAVEIEEGRPTL